MLNTLVLSVCTANPRCRFRESLAAIALQIKYNTAFQRQYIYCVYYKNILLLGVGYF